MNDISKFLNLALYRQRRFEESIDFSIYEKSLGFQFPTMYKLFHSLLVMYDTDSICSYINEKGHSRSYLSLDHVGFGLEGTSIGNIRKSDILNHLPEMRRQWYLQKDEDETNYFYDLNFLSLADCTALQSQGGMLEVGTQGEYIDKVVAMEDTHDLSSLKVICDNIFEFASGYKIFQRPNSKINICEIYRNYNEEFWRLNNIDYGSI